MITQLPNHHEKDFLTLRAQKLHQEYNSSFTNLSSGLGAETTAATAGENSIESFVQIDAIIIGKHFTEETGGVSFFSGIKEPTDGASCSLKSLQTYQD
jgi:hypothetical protein